MSHSGLPPLVHKPCQNSTRSFSIRTLPPLASLEVLERKSKPKKEDLQLRLYQDIVRLAHESNLGTYQFLCNEPPLGFVKNVNIKPDAWFLTTRKERRIPQFTYRPDLMVQPPPPPVFKAPQPVFKIPPPPPLRRAPLQLSAAPSRVTVTPVVYANEVLPSCCQPTPRGVDTVTITSDKADFNHNGIQSFTVKSSNSIGPQDQQEGPKRKRASLGFGIDDILDTRVPKRPKVDIRSQWTNKLLETQISLEPNRRSLPGNEVRTLAELIDCFL